MQTYRPNLKALVTNWCRHSQEFKLVVKDCCCRDQILRYLSQICIVKSGIEAYWKHIAWGQVRIYYPRDASVSKSRNFSGCSVVEVECSYFQAILLCIYLVFNHCTGENIVFYMSQVLSTFLIRILFKVFNWFSPLWSWLRC